MTYYSRLTTKLLLASIAILAVAQAQVLAHPLYPQDPQEKDVIKKEYVVRPGGTLELEMDRGQIVVEKVSGNKVLIELKRTAIAETRDAARKILRQHQYTLDKRDNDVFVSSQLDRERGLLQLRKRRKLKIEVVVRIPKRYHVDFSSGAGNIHIKEVEGRVNGRTGAGNITIADVRGVVDITSGAGNIEINGDIKRASVNTGAGNITLRGLQGAVDANTGTGNIRALVTRQPEYDSSFHTGAGNIDVELPDDVMVYVMATAALGSATCEFPKIEVAKKWLAQSFSGTINGDGGPEIRMYAGVGNVTLRKTD